MEALKISEHQEQLDWEYDPAADVLYLSLGKPQLALGVDIGDGVVVRYGETSNEVVGLTVVGLRQKLARRGEERCSVRGERCGEDCDGPGRREGDQGGGGGGRWAGGRPIQGRARGRGRRSLRTVVGWGAGDGPGRAGRGRWSARATGRARVQGLAAAVASR